MNEVEVAEALRKYIAEEFLANQADDLDLDTQLLELGVIDSISILSIVSFIETRFGVKVGAKRMTAKNLSSIRNMVSMVVGDKG